uniref:Uncharacterized protein n=1 Tax=Rhizophora mucronata TaxID=61149 RepID=A0A2P2PCR2_RHIMU
MDMFIYLLYLCPGLRKLLSSVGLDN